MLELSPRLRILAMAPLLVALASSNSAASPPGRFEVSLVTSGDSIVDPATGDRLDAETEHAKATRSVELHYATPAAIPDAIFMVPPWKGGVGRTLDAAYFNIGSSEEEELGHKVYWGVGPTATPGHPRKPLHDALSYGAGTYTRASQTSRDTGVGATYAVVSPDVVKLTLPPDLRYLDPPTSLRAVDAGPAGYQVSWSPVERAVGYEVTAYTRVPSVRWQSYGVEWTGLGTARALAQGVLLRAPHCVIPAGIFPGSFRVEVHAISCEVRRAGPIPAIGFAESDRSLDVTPAGAVPFGSEGSRIQPNRPSDPFLAAVFDGDLAHVKELVEREPAIVNRPPPRQAGRDFEPFEDRSPLSWAVACDRIDVVQYLVEHGARVNLTASPPVWLASQLGDPKVLGFLLDHGGKVVQSKDYDALLVAIQAGSLENVRLLLQHGARLNVKDQWGSPPLTLAQFIPSTSQSRAMRQLLRSFGARLDTSRAERAASPQRALHRRYPKPTRQEVFAALKSAPSLELLSIEPGSVRLELGRVRVAGAQKGALVAALETSIRQAKANDNLCFRPRHALLARTPHGCYFVLICFECEQVYATRIEPDRPLDLEGIYGARLKMFTTDSAAAVFNRVLKRHHLRLASQLL